MKLGNAAGRAVIDNGHGWIDVHNASSGRYGPDPASLYNQWRPFRAWAHQQQQPGDPTKGYTGPWLPPSPQPSQVIAIGANYHDHARELHLDDDDLIVAFTKFPSCLTGNQSHIELPSTTIDWEVELVAIISTPARHVNETDAWHHVAGLTIGQDLTDRHLQLARPGRQYSLAKSFPGAGPTGPWLVTPDELDNPDDLTIGCAFNGETRQLARTSQMRRSVSRIIAELSSHITLEPGDLIFTGSPSGAGHSQHPAHYLTQGILTSWIDGIGTLTIHLNTPHPDTP